MCKIWHNLLNSLVPKKGGEIQIWGHFEEICLPRFLFASSLDIGTEICVMCHGSLSCPLSSHILPLSLISSLSLSYLSPSLSHLSIPLLSHRGRHREYQGEPMVTRGNTEGGPGNTKGILGRPEGIPREA